MFTVIIIGAHMYLPHGLHIYAQARIEHVNMPAKNVRNMVSVQCDRQRMFVSSPTILCSERDHVFHFQCIFCVNARANPIRYRTRSATDATDRNYFEPKKPNK